MFETIKIPTHEDERGQLSFVESLNNIPFSVKRIYWLCNQNQEVVRGNHAHKDLKQLLICISGSVDIELDNGKQKEIIHLGSPKKGLLIESMIWRKLYNFSSNSIILVLASEYYSEDDYYRTYEDFLNACSLS